MNKSEKEKKQAEADASECALYLKALGDSKRLQIIRALLACPLTVTDLTLLLDTEIANVSHHLRVLYHAKLVTTERDGKYIYYHINREVIRSKSISQTLDFGCCQLEWRK